MKPKPIPPEYEGQDVAYCGKCKQWKPRSEFYKDANGARGAGNRCKFCVLEWRRQNSAYLVQKAMEWQRNNPEKAREHGDKWRAKNAEKVKEYASVARKRHWQKVKSDPVLLEKDRLRKREFARKYQALHPGISTEKHHVRKARKHGGGGTYTTAEWKKLCEHYGNICLCCGEHKPLTIDHVVPLALGGSNSIDNLQPLCGTCNCAKGTRTIDYRPDRK
jgi:5-methylcytosine-specific restriction endonuclease McrA